jgi:2,3-bisphosphoglycerate-independent phosphoglycerate mutase
MKFLIVIPDGIGDLPLSALGGKTPLEVSRVPNLNYFSKIGKVGTISWAADRSDTSSHSALSAVFGYEPKRYMTGPGPLEAANMEIKLEDNEIAFRINFVTETQGILADATAGRITTKEARALINFLNKKLSSEFVRFFPGQGHRHLAVIKDARGYDALSAVCRDPEAIVGKSVEENLAKGPGQDLIKKLVYDAKLLLEEHEINQVRVDLGENPANMIWFWGQGSTPKLPKFSERFGGLTGATISTAGLVKGFSRLVGLTVMELSTKHVYPDFDYKSEASAMLDLFQEKDLVCIHLRACDLAAREGNVQQKVMSLEAIDQHIMGTAKLFYEKEKDVRVLIAPFHSTSCEERARLKEAVPFIVAGKNIVADEIECFHESAARVSQLRFSEGWKLMDMLISGKEMV